MPPPFDGTEATPTTTYDERTKTYVASRVVVSGDRAICEHVGCCGKRTTNVWKVVGGAGTEDSELLTQMMLVIERCPSGALTYRLEPDGEDLEPVLAVGIAVTADGPYAVTGSVPVERSDWPAFEARNRVTLCRCGRSA
jgi:uncharacterized Fe-S cluster protein YjdI